MSERFTLTEDVADAFLARIHDACERLAEMPGIGHYREDLVDRNYRFWTVDSYLIVYRWQSAPLQIISIVHGARNLRHFFATRPTE